MEFINEAFDSNYIAPLGPQVDVFEKEFAEYVGIKHCLAVSSGTAAMPWLNTLCCPAEFNGVNILRSGFLGVGQRTEDRGRKTEDRRRRTEVIASTLTFIGSVTPVIFQGAELTFVDCDRESWNIDPDLLKEALAYCKRRGKLPKAVVPTDLYGQCVNYGRIFEICEEYEVPVVADAAEALGAKYQRSEVRSQKSEKDRDQISDVRDQISKTDLRPLTSDLWFHAGVGAKAAVFSFNGNKIITTSGGGMLASDDKEFIDYARFLSQQAREDFPHYEHTQIGFNYRMSNVLAAIGRATPAIASLRLTQARRAGAVAGVG